MSEHVSVQPIERSARPVGTIEEAQAENLDPTVYPTCSRPNRVNGVVGCAWFDKCRVSAKGVSGPRNYGIEIIKGPAQGGGFVRINTDCMWIADHAENYEKNGGAVKVKAEEGQENVIVQGTLVSKKDGKPTFQGDPMGIRKKMAVPVVVPPYPRPGQNPALLEDMIRAESIESEKERRTDEAKARAYGLADAVTPIDKRPAGANAGRKAAGGGSA